jgi:ABC-type branched-subunit amino acid transport system ATPase component
MLDVLSLEAWYGQAQVLYGVSLGVATAPASRRR